MYANLWRVCSCHVACVRFYWCRFQGRAHEPPAVLDLHLHVWETEVKVAETKQTAFPLVAGAAAVALRPGRFGARPSPARLLQSVVSPVNPGAPHPVHTTVLIRLIGLDLELPPVPVAPAPVTCGPC